MGVTFPTKQLIGAHRTYSFENQSPFQILDNNDGCYTKIRSPKPRIESLQTPTLSQQDLQSNLSLLNFVFLVNKEHEKINS